MILMYHRATIELLGEQPSASPMASSLIDERQRALGITFPPSVREWYSLEGAVELLAHYSNQDHPVPLALLGEEIEGGPLILMHENQGVCRWAMRLDAGDDPPVLVSPPEPGTGEAVWEPYADRFSTFVYTQIWDWAPNDEERWPCGLQAQDQPLAAPDLDYLRAHFTEGPRTYNWPAKSTYRFSDQHGRILIWDDETRQADWWLWARSPNDLTALARSVWQCGTLETTLCEASACGGRVLDGLRA